MSIRVLIVDDSPLARGILRSLLETDPEMEIIGEAGDGRQAVEMAHALKPQVITMDLKMPVMDGVAAVTAIMAANPLPILVVSGIADASEACEAIAHGALDAIAKPELDEAAGIEFVARVRMVSRIRVITHLDTRTVHPRLPPAAGRQPPLDPWQLVFAIASSTGGPQALAQLLGALPADFPCPVLISQHISAGFAPGLAQWLAGLCPLPVRLAAEGEVIQGGRVYLSPSETNLSVNASRRLSLAVQDPAEIYHPSCDALLAGVAEAFGPRSVGIILTGMGRDGLFGLQAVKRAGGMVLAQDEASSVIFGMNKVAIDAGLADQVLELRAIAAAMIRLAAASAPAGVP